MLQDHVAFRIDDETDVEEAILPVGMAGFGLSDDESIVLACELAEIRGLLTRDVDCAFAGELNMIEIQHLVVESLQSAFGKRDQSHRKIEARQPCGCLDQMRKMLEVEQDVAAF